MASSAQNENNICSDGAPQSAGKIFTFGHSDHKPEAIISILKKFNIEHVFDVRGAPGSARLNAHRPGALQTCLAQNNIKYSSMKELGGTHGIHPSNNLNAVHSNLKSSKGQIAVDDIINTANGTKCSVVLMCSERNHVNCHRTVVANAISSLSGMQVEHLSYDQAFNALPRPNIKDQTICIYDSGATSVVRRFRDGMELEPTPFTIQGVGGIEQKVEKTTAGEYIAESGPELAPMGKAAVKADRTFAWVGGDSQPFYGKLSPEKKAIIRSLLSEDLDLMHVQNWLPVMSPGEAEQLYTDLAAKNPNANFAFLSKDVHGSKTGKKMRKWLFEVPFVPPDVAKMIKLVPTMGIPFTHCICTANPATFEDGKGLDVHDAGRKIVLKDFEFKIKESQRITAFFKDGILYDVVHDYVSAKSPKENRAVIPFKEPADHSVTFLNTNIQRNVSHPTESMFCAVASFVPAQAFPARALLPKSSCCNVELREDPARDEFFCPRCGAVCDQNGLKYPDKDIADNKNGAVPDQQSDDGKDEFIVETEIVANDQGQISKERREEQARVRQEQIGDAIPLYSEVDRSVEELMAIIVDESQYESRVNPKIGSGVPFSEAETLTIAKFLPENHSEMVTDAFWKSAAAILRSRHGVDRKWHVIKLFYQNTLKKKWREWKVKAAKFHPRTFDTDGQVPIKLKRGAKDGGRVGYAPEESMAICKLIHDMKIEDNDPSWMRFEKFLKAKHNIHRNWSSLRSHYRKVLKPAWSEKLKLAEKFVVPKFLPARGPIELSEDCVLHYPKNPNCSICQQASLQDLHRRRAHKVVRIGVLAIDLAFFEDQICLIMTDASNAIEDSDLPPDKMVHVVELGGKSAAEVRKALCRGLLEVEHQYGVLNIRRVHSDCGTEWAEVKDDMVINHYILPTSTQANDSQSNGTVESVIGVLKSCARASLLESGLGPRFWGSSMIHAAALVTLSSRGHNDDARINFKDLLPFGALTMIGRGSKIYKKLGSVVPRGRLALYLHPIPGLTRVLVIDTNQKSVDLNQRDLSFSMLHLDDLLTYAPIKRNKKHVFAKIVNDKAIPTPKERHILKCVDCGKYRHVLSSDLHSLNLLEAPGFKCSRIVDSCSSQGAVRPTMPQGAGLPLMKRISPGGALEQFFAVGNNLAHDVSYIAEIHDYNPNDAFDKADTTPGDDLNFDGDLHCFQSSASERSYARWDDGVEDMKSQLHTPTTPIIETGFVYQEIGMKKGPGHVGQKVFDEKLVKEISKYTSGDALGPPEAFSLTPEGAVLFDTKCLFGMKKAELAYEDQEAKARMVVLGHLGRNKNGKIVFSSKKSTEDFWAPTSPLSSLRVATHIAALKKWEISSVDLSQAYLQSVYGGQNTFVRLDPLVFPYLTDEFKKKIEDLRAQGVPDEEIAFPVVGSLYGLVRSGFDFSQALRSSLISSGWKASTSDPAMYYKDVNGDRIILLSYVDDLLLIAPKGMSGGIWKNILKGSPGEMKQGVDRWRADPPVIVSKETSLRFLGVVINGDPESGYDLDQTEYSEAVISQYEERSNSTIRARTTQPQYNTEKFERVVFDDKDTGAADDVITKDITSDRLHIPTVYDWGDLTPMGCFVKKKDFSDNQVRAHSTIGGLMYLCRGTRLDISNQVQRLAENVHQWSEECESTLKGLLGYIKQTHCKLSYQAPDSEIVEYRDVCQSDSSYVAPLSRSGMVYLVKMKTKSGKEFVHVIDYKVSKQRWASLSSAHAELVALTTAIRNTIISRNLVKELVHESSDRNRYMVTLTDASAVIAAIRRGYSVKLSSASRIVGCSLAWLVDHAHSGSIRFSHLSGVHNLSDILTKPINASNKGLLEQFLSTKSADDEEWKAPIMGAPIDAIPLHVPTTVQDVNRGYSSCKMCSQHTLICPACKICRVCGCACAPVDDVDEEDERNKNLQSHDEITRNPNL